MPFNQDEFRTLPLNMEEIDAVSYAGAIGASAAARLHALLTDPDKEFNHRWFTDSADVTLEDVEKVINLLADHVCTKHETNPETLYRHAAHEGIIDNAGSDWFGEGVARRLSWTLFQSTCLAVFDVIDAEQKRAMAGRQIAAAAAAAQPLALEDSIFAPQPGLGDMLPHAVAALAMGAARQEQETADAVALSIDADEPMSAAAPLGEEGDAPFAGEELLPEAQPDPAAGKKRGKPN